MASLMARGSSWHGVFAVDPGMTTGLCWGAYPSKGSVADMLAKGKKTGHAQLTAGDAQAEYPNAWSVEQAIGLAIAKRWWTFALVCLEAGVTPQLVIEDFVLRVGKGSAKREGLAPVRINATIEAAVWFEVRALRHLIETGVVTTVALDQCEVWLWAPVYQQAGLAKGYCKDDRLKLWGMWFVGQQHARDAARHLARYLASQKAQI